MTRLAAIFTWFLIFGGCLALYGYALVRAQVILFDHAHVFDALAVVAGLVCIALLVGLDEPRIHRRRR